MTHIGGSEDFNVVFIGAGNIMFGASAYTPPRNLETSVLTFSKILGSDEGPWNHSFRFEQCVIASDLGLASLTCMI